MAPSMIRAGPQGWPFSFLLLAHIPVGSLRTRSAWVLRFATALLPAIRATVALSSGAVV